jgi:hypothetical protein
LFAIKYHTKPLRNGGNILFLILIAVALFAALSYAVTATSRSNESSISKDQYKLITSRLDQYAAQIRNGITRVMVMHGCSDTQLNFDTPVWSSGSNPNAPSDGRCDVFSPDAGGAIVMEFEFSDRHGLKGSHRVRNVGTDGLSDIVLGMRIYDKGLCDYINGLEGLGALSSSQPIFGYNFNGNYNFNTSGGFVYVNNDAFGKWRFCTNLTSDTAQYYIWYVLYAK